MDLAVVTGILGTLGGTAIGGFITYKVQGRQLAHVDRTRFHNHRLDAYADFVRFGNSALAGFHAGQVDTSAIDGFWIAMTKTRLVAASGIVESAGHVADCVQQVYDEFGHGGAVDVALLDRANVALETFVQACRAELGVAD